MCLHNNSVSHHDGCRLVHPDMWYHLNAIRHHDGCRLVHPAKWDIGQFRGAFVTDVDWCIPSGGSFGISIQFKMSGIGQFVYNSIYHSPSFGFQISHFNSIFTFVLSFKDILNLYTHFIYSFAYSFHILIHVLISYLLGKLPKYLK